MDFTPAFLGKHLVALSAVEGAPFAVVVLDDSDDDLEDRLLDIELDESTWLIVLDLRDREGESAAAARGVTPSFDRRPAPEWIRRKIDLDGALVDDDGSVLPQQERVAPARPIFGLDMDDCD